MRKADILDNQKHESGIYHPETIFTKDCDPEKIEYAINGMMLAISQVAGGHRCAGNHENCNGEACKTLRASMLSIIYDSKAIYNLNNAEYLEAVMILINGEMIL